MCIAYRQLLYRAFFVVLLVFSCVQGYAAPNPLALLKGVERARLQCEPIRMEFTTDYVQDEDYGTITISSVAEVRGASRRFEEFPVQNTNIFPGCVTTLHNGEVNHFRRSEAGSVNLYDFAEAVKRANIVYDPRIIGLISLPSPDATVKDALCYVAYPDVTMIGSDNIDGNDVWHIRCKDNFSNTADFWVAEPSFRVYRVVIDIGQGKGGMRVDSKYDSHSVGPFPSEVHIDRFERGKHAFNRTIKITKVEFGRSITDERFTLAAMDLPLNTEVVDYRIHRRLGYWDGEKLVDDPVRVSAQELRELMEKQPSFSIVRVLLMGIGGLMIALALFLMVRKKS